MIFDLYNQLKQIADVEFYDIVLNSEIHFSSTGRGKKLRVNLLDGTFVDIWYSVEGEYSYHWEQRRFRDTVYRHDNAPHSKWLSVKTFPKHCHDGTDANVCESRIPDNPIEAIREFFRLVRQKLLKPEGTGK